MFIRGMTETVKAKIAISAPKNIQPGDILVTNDAYITGSHLNHFTFTHAGVPRGRADRLRLLHGALARRRRHAGA